MEVELAAAMAAACCVLLLPRCEWLEPRREMLSSADTSFMEAMMAETRQVMTLDEEGEVRYGRSKGRDARSSTQRMKMIAGL